jgi:hypothetical protein
MILAAAKKNHQQQATGNHAQMIGSEFSRRIRMAGMRNEICARVDRIGFHDL